MALLVAGMHRSGTSAITRVVNLLGANAGPRLIAGQAGVNDQGFWEHADAVDFHERVLRWHTTGWHDFRALPASAFVGDLARAEVDEIRALVARDFAAADRWVLKDPRLSRLVPLWTQALAGSRWTPHFVLPVRHPAEVAASLERRDGMPRVAAMLLWSRHVLDAVAHTEGHPRAVSDYAQLLQDWRTQLARIAAGKIRAGRAVVGHEQGVAGEQCIADKIGIVGRGVARDVQGNRANRPDRKALAIIDQMIKLRAIALEGGALVENLAEHVLNGDYLAPDRQFPADPLLEIGRR